MSDDPELRVDALVQRLDRLNDQEQKVGRGKGEEENEVKKNKKRRGFEQKHHMMGMTIFLSDVALRLQLHLNLLEVHHKQKSDMEEGSVASLKALGAEICGARFKSALSSWEYENPQQVCKKFGRQQGLKGCLKRVFL